jgi:endoglucanase
VSRTRLVAALLLLAPAAAPAAAGPEPQPDAHAVARRLGRGINLGNALDAPSEGEWGVTLRAEYFAAIRRAGFQSVRLPVRWSAHAGEAAPFALDRAFAERVDWAVDQALANDLAVVLDQHHNDAMDGDPAAALPRLRAIWEQVARRHRDRPEQVVFELHNEPHGALDDAAWNRAFPELLAAVRATNPRRAVVVGPASWNDLDHLEKLELPAGDRMLIATFHDYRPFEFTHQGAPWAEGSAAWKGRTWAGTPEQLAALRRDFAKVEAWAKAHDRPVYLGEFGAFEAAPLDSRVAWTAAVAREAERRGFPWAYWEFCSGFGAYDAQADAWREPLLHALVPPAR